MNEALKNQQKTNSSLYHRKRAVHPVLDTSRLVDIQRSYIHKSAHYRVKRNQFHSVHQVRGDVTPDYANKTQGNIIKTYNPF